MDRGEKIFTVFVVGGTLFLFSMIYLDMSKFMPMTVTGKVVAYTQSQNVFLKYKTTKITMVWDSISINEGENPISIGERTYYYNGWHDFELGNVYKIYSKGEWYWAHPSIIDMKIVQTSEKTAEVEG